MKAIILSALFLLPAICWSQYKADDKLEKTLKFEKESPANVLYLANINGDIKVRTSEDGEIHISTRRTINAKTAERFEEAKKVEIGVKDLYDTLLVYVTGVCGEFGKRSERWSRDKTKWSYNWDECEDRFSYNMDFEIRVPEGLNMVLSTINDGDISVDASAGNLRIRNVNGSISVEDGKGELYAHTVNGDVDITLNQSPSHDMDLYTLNGDINLNYPGKLNADISWESFNGDLYTNEEVVQLPMQVIESKNDNQEGISRKLEAKSRMRVGKGGVLLVLETFNGDAYLKNTSINN